MDSPTIAPELDLFLDRLIEETHGATLPADLARDMKRDLYGRLENHLMAATIQALPTEHATAFESLMSGAPATEEVQNFFKQHIPDYSNMYAEALLEFRDVYRGAAGAK